MQARDLKPACQLVANNGVKLIMYGEPGIGKTPLLETAPNVVLCASEPGLLSMRKSQIPTWEAYTGQRQREFMDWLFQSSEARRYDTVAFDSISQTAENVAQEISKKPGKHGLQAYGEMAREVEDWIEKLYRLPQKHVILIAKQERWLENGTTFKKPFFPGKYLPISIPHKFDEIIHFGHYIVPGMGNAPIKALRCWGDGYTHARDRSGNLAEFEPPHLGQLFAKAMR